MARYNIALAERVLDDLERAVSELVQVMVTNEAMQYPNLPSDRAMLEQMRRVRHAG